MDRPSLEQAGPHRAASIDGNGLQGLVEGRQNIQPALRTRRNTTSLPLNRVLQFFRIASNTGCASVIEPLITRRISAVAVCCSRVSASRLSASPSRFWSWLDPGVAFFCDLRATGNLAFAFAGFARRRIGLFLLFIDDRLGERVPEGKR